MIVDERRRGQFTVLTDRAQGCSSLAEGEVMNESYNQSTGFKNVYKLCLIEYQHPDHDFSSARVDVAQEGVKRR